MGHNIHQFRAGKYRGTRLAMDISKTTPFYEFYGEYDIEPAGFAKDGTPMVRINGGRKTKVFVHSKGTKNFVSGENIHLEASVCVYDPKYKNEKRYMLDEIHISADPQFFVGE